MNSRIQHFEGLNIGVVREDEFKIGRANGTKARAIWAMSKDATALYTAGGRHGTQGLTTAAIAKEKGIPCVYYCPRGEVTPILSAIKELGATIVRCKVGYRSVVNARA